MEVNLREVFYKAFTIATICLCSVQAAFAGLSSVTGVTSRADAMQSFTAVADDPSAIYYNPAGLTQINGTQIDATTALIVPNVNYNNSFTQTDTHSNRKSIANNMFFSTDYYNPVVLGIGVYVPFARNSSFVTNAATGNFPLSRTLVRTDVVPTIAYSLTQNISLGASLVASRINITSNALGLNEDAKGYGVTAQVGALFKLPSHIQVGIDYRGPMDSRLKINGFIPPVLDDTTISHVKFPGVVSAGLAWQPIDPLVLAASYEYEMWSYVQNVTRIYNSPILGTMSVVTNINGKDVGSIRVGAKYRPEYQDEFQAGYSYIPNSIPESVISPVLVDFDTHVFSVGYSRYVKNWRFDLGYEYQKGKNLTSTFNLFPGNYKLSLSTFMAGISYNFCNAT